jgi:predicted secreted Zn-dependent protease
VIEKIRAKYRRLIQTPHWSTGELKRLSRGLRKYVSAWEEEKKRTARRLVWDVKSYLALIDRHGELTKTCELMARIVAEQKEKELLRFKPEPTVQEADMTVRRRG